MRYILYGAGAIGGAIGGALAIADCEVVLIARGQHFVEILESGLLFQTPIMSKRLNLPVVDDLAHLEGRADDIVILATKTQDTVAALGSLANWAPRGIAVMCAQNGVENERIALRYFPNVYGMRVNVRAAHLTPGCVTLYATPIHGLLDVGRYPHGVDQRVDDVTADLSKAGFTSLPQDDIMRWKYRKLLMNLANAVDAACGAEAPDAQRLSDLASAEAQKCFAAANIEVATIEEDQARRSAIGPHGTVDGASYPGNSSWQSLARGLSTTEVDYLNGEVVQLGRLLGIRTPANEVLQEAVHSILRDQLAPGSVSSSDLMSAIARRSNEN